MPCLKKRPPAPPQWYVMRASVRPGEVCAREGPYSRAGIAQMVKECTLADNDMVWTNERIFPNTKKPKHVCLICFKKKLTRQTQWKRYDQLPDPVRKLIQIEIVKVPDRRAKVAPGQEELPPPVPGAQGVPHHHHHTHSHDHSHDDHDHH